MKTSPNHLCNPLGSQTGDVARVQWHCHLLLFGAILRFCFLQSIEPASSTDCCYWSKPWGYKTSTQKCTFKPIKIFNLDINLRASLGWQKFPALCLDRNLIALMFMLFKNIFGALGLSGAVSLKNFFSTTVKTQFAEQLKLVSNETSAERPLFKRKTGSF